jgi:hypothetical protein
MLKSLPVAHDAGESLKLTPRDTLYEHLTLASRQYASLSGHFVIFRESLLSMTRPGFPLKGVSIRDEGDHAVRATFVGCTVRLRFAYDRPNQTGILIAEKIEGGDRDPLTLFDFGFGTDGVALDIEPHHGSDISMSSKTDAVEIVLHALDLALEMAPR